MYLQNWSKENCAYDKHAICIMMHMQYTCCTMYTTVLGFLPRQDKWYNLSLCLSTENNQSGKHICCVHTECTMSQSEFKLDSADIELNKTTVAIHVPTWQRANAHGYQTRCMPASSQLEQAALIKILWVFFQQATVARTTCTCTLYM